LINEERHDAYCSPDVISVMLKKKIINSMKYGDKDHWLRPY